MAKRVNIRFLTIFLTILTAVAIIVAALAWTSPWLYSKLLRHNPKHWITLGDTAAGRGDWDSAVNDYGTALQLDPTNKAVCVQLGEAWYQLASEDDQNIRKATGSWTRALEIDPQYVPALQKLLHLDRELVDQYPGQQQLYGQVRDTARRLAQADPTDTDAKAAVDIATVQQWLAQGAVPDKEFQQSLSALQTMQQHDPANAELVYYLGRAYILLGAKALKQGDSSDIADNYDKQARSLVDSALAIKPDDAVLNRRAYQVYAELSVAAHLTAIRTAADQSAAAAIANAAAHAKPDDALYPDIILLSAQWDLHHDKKSEAEASLANYVKQFPDDLRARVFFANALAESLGKRDDAITLLSQPISDQKEAGPKGAARRGYRMAVLQTLTSLEIDKCDATADPAGRQNLMAKIDPQLTQLLANAPDNPVNLRMKGTVEFMKGEHYEAVKTLTRARNILEANANRDARTYFEVLYQLGAALMSEGQDTSAEKTLEQAALMVANFVPIHEKLAALYLQDQNFDQASAHIDAIVKANPNDPALPRLQLALDQLNKRPDQAEHDLGLLPEKTHADLIIKARAAAGLGDFKEAARLLQSALDQKRNDPQISLALADVQNRLGQKDKAIATLQGQLQLTPHDNTIALVLSQLQNASSAEIGRIRDQILEGSSEFSKAINKFGQDYNNHKFDDALTDLKNAQHAGDNDRLVEELYFQLYLARQQYDEAAGVIITLAHLNADDADGLTYQVRLAMARNHHDEAIHAAQQLTSNRPELAMSWVMLGDAYRGNGQYDLALQNYRQALDRQALNAEALAGEIDCYVALNQQDNAAATIAAALRLFPDNASFRAADLDFKMTYGNPEDVVAELERAIAAKPNDISNYLVLVEACMQTANARSAGHGDNGPHPWLDKAQDALAQGLSKWPNDVRLIPLMAQVKQANGDFAGALKLLNDFAALPEWKNRAEPQIFLADLYNRAGESKETEQALRAALADNKNDISLQIKLSSFLAAVGKFDDALAVLADTSDPAVALQRLQLLINAGRFAEAESGLEAAMAKSPDDVNLLYLLSLLHADTGHYQDADADVQHGLKIDPKNVPLMLQSARLEMSRPHGDMNLARRQLTALLQTSPKNLDAHVMLSDLYARQNQLDTAISEMETAMHIAPLDKPLRARLAKLYMAYDPPEWTQFDQILHEAEASDQLSSDPTWLDLESEGLFKRDQNSDAIAKMRQALTMAPSNSSLERDYINLLLQAKQFDDVIQEADRVLAAGKHYWWLHEMRGIALVRLDRKQEAQQEFLAALNQADAEGQHELAGQIIMTIGTEIDPDAALTVLLPRMANDTSWKLLGVRLYQQKGDNAQALKIAEEVSADPLSSSSQRLAATQAVAQCAQQEGLFDKSKAAYLSWLEQSPNDVIALNNLACLLNDNLKQPQEALQYSRQAYNLANASGPSVSPLITDTQAWVLISCGGADAKNGMSMLQQLVQDHGDFIFARYHLAEAYIQTGNTDAAMAQLSAALDQIKTQEAKHIVVPVELKKNIDQAMNQAKQAAAKNEATGTVN
jgi:tetratricopeptide (TPR) repeat protein